MPDLIVSYDPSYSLALVNGPGGFTQITMSEQQAAALAYAIGARFDTTGQYRA